MMEGGRGEANTRAATLECFTFSILDPTTAEQLWGFAHGWMKSQILNKLNMLLEEWIRLLEIMKQDHVAIILKGCHGWVGEPATLFTCMTPEERAARFSPVAKKNRMVDTTLMTTPWVEHPESPVSQKSVIPYEPRPIVSLADRVAMEDVTTTMKLVDAGGHVYYMTHVPRWGRLHSINRHRASETNRYLTFESSMAAVKKQAGPNDAIRRPEEVYEEDDAFNEVQKYIKPKPYTTNHQYTSRTIQEMAC